MKNDIFNVPTNDSVHESEVISMNANFFPFPIHNSANESEVIRMSNNVFTPRILVESHQGWSAHDIRDEMLRNRELECTGEINSDSVYSLCRQLRYLQQKNPNAEITMFINSPGGSVYNGLALYDVMKGISCPIRTVCLGTAASMGALLFAAGDQRDIMPHGKVMIHDPLISQTGGNALQLREISDNLMKTRENIGTLLAQFTGRTLEEIYEKTARDSWFTAEEAVSFGLADRIIQTI